MSKQVGPLEICCDAPPYCVVRACRGVGIRSPEDVRWLRLSTFRRPVRPRGVMDYLWELVRGTKRPAGTACTCGRGLPELKVVIVEFDEGEELPYLFGQCPRCQTVFWDGP